MASAVYSLRIYAHASLTASPSPVGPIVPSGLVYIVRDIDVNEISATNGSLMLVMNQVLGPLTAFQRTTADPLGLGQWRGRQVYNEGEQVGFKVISGTWSIACSGYQLTLP